MVIKLMFFYLVLLNAYFVLVEADGEIIWAPNGGDRRCEMRFQNDKDSRACDRFNGPSVRGDTTFMRVFTAISAFEETSYSLRDQNYRCFDLLKISGINYKKVVAEKILYGTFYLESPNGKWVKKGKFGPLFVRSRNTSTQFETKKIPGYYAKTIYNEADHHWFRFFIPQLRRDYDNDPDYDATIKEWDAGKRDYSFAASLSVVCHDEEKHCEPRPSSLSSTYLLSYTPLVRGTSYDMDPKIKQAYLDLTNFYLELEKWYTWPQDNGYNWYTSQINSGGLPGYSNGQACRNPKVHFVIYDSNPAPHDACETDPNRWDFKNGEVRAVFAKWSLDMSTYTQQVLSGQYPVNMAYLTKSWTIKLSDSGWNEDQLRFLAEWQVASPLDLDDSDTSWYKNWRKSTGMSVAFTFCACKDFGSFSSPIYGCREYVHKQVEIRGRDDWLY